MHSNPGLTPAPIFFSLLCTGIVYLTPLPQVSIFSLQPPINIGQHVSLNIVLLEDESTVVMN